MSKKREHGEPAMKVINLLSYAVEIEREGRPPISFAPSGFCVQTTEYVSEFIDHPSGIPLREILWAGPDTEKLPPPPKKPEMWIVDLLTAAIFRRSLDRYTFEDGRMAYVHAHLVYPVKENGKVVALAFYDIPPEWERFVLVSEDLSERVITFGQTS